MIGYIFSNVLLQLLYLMGSIFVIGLIINFLSGRFYKTAHYHPLAIYGTGLIGTPIHELSHALMCLVFGHTIQDIVLFQVDSDSGTLGYVSHSYRKNNVWHLIGNYFIGVAPIACGAVFLLLGIKLLLPETYVSVSAELDAFSIYIGGGASWGWISRMGELIVGILSVLFSEALTSYKWWIFIVLAMCVALHMNLSGADIKGALPALPIVALAVTAVNLILGFISASLYADFLTAINKAGGYLMGVLLLSVTLSLIYVALAYFIKLIAIGLKRTFSR